LLDHVIKKANKRNCSVIDVAASPYNKGAQKFYKSYGFCVRKESSKRFRYAVK
jgi:ribosomal protein S18 acetylase RimI-like enzyme